MKFLAYLPRHAMYYLNFYGGINVYYFRDDASMKNLKLLDIVNGHHMLMYNDISVLYQQQLRKICTENVTP